MFRNYQYNEDSNLDILDIVMVVTCIISENCNECQILMMMEQQMLLI